jgi:hypothetical protein
MVPLLKSPLLTQLMPQAKLNQLIDSLIIECLSRKSLSFDDTFLCVGRSFPINTRQPEHGSVPPRFYFLVQSRMKSLKRRELVSYDRKNSCWCYNADAAEKINGKAAIPA